MSELACAQVLSVREVFFLPKVLLWFFSSIDKDEIYRFFLASKAGADNVESKKKNEPMHKSLSVLIYSNGNHNFVGLCTGMQCLILAEW